jgi:hypothetical protein
MYKYGGAFSLVGLEFFYRAREDAPELRIGLDGLQRDGESYRATNVRANKPLEDSFQPKELTVKRGSRERRDPVIQLMRRLKINPQQYLEPLLTERSATGLGEYLTPETQFGQQADERRACMSQPFGEQGRGYQMGELLGQEEEAEATHLCR